MEKYLNIIAFNIPWPANYGGIIDVYYKIKALHQCGVKIILHCFEYERAHSPELEAICEKVFYYKRHTGLRTNITLLPYNVYSRKHPELIANLLKNDYPILFEGLHCCYYINDPRLHNRKRFTGKQISNTTIIITWHRRRAIRSGKLLPDRGLAIQTLSENTETCRSDDCRFNNRC